MGRISLRYVVAPLGLALLAFLLKTSLIGLSLNVPTFPSAQYLALLTGRPPLASDAAYLAVASAHRWFVDAVLPGVVGILVGFVAMWLRPSLLQLACAAALFGLASGLESGLSVPLWFGVITFMFCLLGSVTLRLQRIPLV